jgi:superoxide dismutase, Cu-Zn family
MRKINKDIHRLTSFALASSLFFLSACACTDNRKPRAEETNKKKYSTDQIALVEEADTKQKEITKAIVHVHPVGDKPVKGIIEFTKVPQGIAIVADVQGLAPGKHGFHVHEHGDCGGTAGSAAGGHFNPTNTKHGGPDSPERHVGDLGNLLADENGIAHYERVDTLISFEGSNSIIGRSIIIHADPDDYVTQPTGNSGARIGCGMIEAVN